MDRLFEGLRHRAKRVLPRPIAQLIQWIRGHAYTIPPGAVRFGDLKRLSPIGGGFSWSRGTPIDRYYIEGFLARNRADIRGCVLELADNQYTQRFGGDQVERSDILAVEANPKATITADLENADALPSAAFDCIILTQALQFIYNLETAITNLCRSLKPGGVLLVTVPGVTPMAFEKWPWYWAFTEKSIRRLLEERFGKDAVSTEAHGNIFAATAFLHGIAMDELAISDLDIDDPMYPVIVAARAVNLEYA